MSSPPHQSICPHTGPISPPQTRRPTPPPPAPAVFRAHEPCPTTSTICTTYWPCPISASSIFDALPTPAAVYPDAEPHILSTNVPSSNAFTQPGLCTSACTSFPRTVHPCTAVPSVLRICSSCPLLPSRRARFTRSLPI